jgi:5-methylcytosine-specific restriction protein A
VARQTPHLCPVPRCPNIVEHGPGRCLEHADGWTRYRASPRGQARLGGYGTRWRRLRDAYLREHPRCEDCGAPATEVHHVDHALPGSPTFLDERNLAALCLGCHRRRSHERERVAGR